MDLYEPGVSRLHLQLRYDFLDVLIFDKPEQHREMASKTQL